MRVRRRATGRGRIRVGLDGRIALGGATLAKGYRNPPERDPFAETGWFVTDDVGKLDASGTLRVLGRTDDAISTGGLTVFPQLVENALASHPRVVDCAVFGVPDDRLGQRVVAAVVAADGYTPPTLAELRTHVKTILDARPRPARCTSSMSCPDAGSARWIAGGWPHASAAEHPIAVHDRPGAVTRRTCPLPLTLTVTGDTFQMSSQYSAMARSDENLPLRAVFRIDIRVHAGDVPPRRAHPLLALDVGRVVGEHQERIVVAQVVDQRPEHLGIPVREGAVRR